SSHRHLRPPPPFPPRRSSDLAAAPVIALAAGMTWFFRDPERGPATGGLLSSADGVVQSIDPQPDGRTRIAVFMNPTIRVRPSGRSEEHTSELQSRFDLVCRLL